MKYIARLLTVVLAGALLCSCMHTESPAARLDRAIFELNEGLRWTRTGDVFARVHPESTEHIIELHKDFGKDIKVGNYEIVRTQLLDSDSKAQVTIQFEWYRDSEMIVHETVLQQQWEDIDGRWLLVAEEVVSGHPL